MQLLVHKMSKMSNCDRAADHTEAEEIAVTITIMIIASFFLTTNEKPLPTDCSACRHYSANSFENVCSSCDVLRLSQPAIILSYFLVLIRMNCVTQMNIACKAESPSNSKPMNKLAHFFRSQIQFGNKLIKFYFLAEHIKTNQRKNWQFVTCGVVAHVKRSQLLTNKLKINTNEIQ